MFSKTVTLFVRHINEVEETNRLFTESAEVGIFKYWKTPSAMINEIAKMHRNRRGDDRFFIENVVIG